MLGPGCVRQTVCKKCKDLTLCELCTRRYTSSQFEMMDAAPIMMPKSLGTDFYVSGAGFDATSTLCCKFEGLDNDVNDGWTPFIIANPPDG